ncbi:MAG: hypothetical protein AB1782_16100 [Cyanobacteriota bacterium]
MLAINNHNSFQPINSYQKRNNNLACAKINTVFQQDTITFLGKEKQKEAGVSGLAQFKEDIRIAWRKLRGLVVFPELEVKQRVTQEFLNRGYKTEDMPHIEFNIWRTEFIAYDPSSNSLNINPCDVQSTRDIIKIVDGIECMQRLARNMGDKINQINREAAKLLGIDSKYAPYIEYSYRESGEFGSYNQGYNLFKVNAFWFDGAINPEPLIAKTIIHEMSHSNTKINSSLITNDDLKEELEKHPDLKRQLDQKPDFFENRNFNNLYTLGKKPPSKGSPEYERIMWHLIQDLKDMCNPKTQQPHLSQNFEKLTLLKKKIASLCDLTYKELFGIDLDLMLETGEIKHKGAYVKALFSEKHRESIINKVEYNKDTVIKLLNKNRALFDKADRDFSGYEDIYDEALARQNAAIGLSKLIEKGVVPDSVVARQLAQIGSSDLQNLILKNDQELKHKIDKGDIKLAG